MALLVVQDVLKSFGGLIALSDVSLSLEEGKINSLIGPNGAGKTTFLDIISGLQKADKGKILFNGQRIDGLESYEITKLGIARNFQEVKVFREMTVLENVMIGTHTRTKAETLSIVCRLPSAKAEEKWSEEYAMSKLELFDLHSFSNNLAGSLSYGLQRKLEIVRALASEPKLLLLDEPTAGLNPHEIDMLNVILELILDSGATILLVEHNMRMVMKVSDRVFVLDYGSKIAEGPPEVISRDEKVIKAYLGKEYERAGN